MDKLKEFEHFVLAILGILAIMMCCKFGHGEVADAIAMICVGSAGSSAAKSIFCPGSKQIIEEKKITNNINE